MMDVQIAEMMDVGAHFGHQTQRWNPKMKPFIFGARSGVHIIDLQKTRPLALEAMKFLRDTVAGGKDVLFVGTKPQAREIIQEHAGRASMYYVTDRWMGGTLTNFQTIKRSIDRLIEMETRRANNDYQGYTKKELLDIDREVIKLEASLGGIRRMTGLPGAIFIVDPKLEHIAIKEALCLNIPIVAITDSNCDPDPIDYVVPGNDDAIGSIAFFVSKMADACLEGLEARESQARDVDRGDDQGRQRGPRRRINKVEGEVKSYVGKGAAPVDEPVDGNYSAKADTTPVDAPRVNTEDRSTSE